MTYRDLITYQQATIIYDFTVEFCKRYVDRSNKSDRSDRVYKSRLFEQMEQAARSGKQNITEGCSVSQTDPKTELKLLGVARGSLKELLEDYEDFLRQKGFGKWGKDDPRAVVVRKLVYRSDKTDNTDKSDRSDKSDRTYQTYSTYEFYRTYLNDPEAAANAMITLINQTNFLLDKQVQAVRDQMEEKGIAFESTQQRARKVLEEERRKKEEFDRWLGEWKKKIDQDKGNDKSDKSDRTDKSDR